MALTAGTKVKLKTDPEGDFFNPLFDGPYVDLVGVVKSSYTSILGRADNIIVEYTMPNGKKKHPHYHETVLEVVS